MKKENQSSADPRLSELLREARVAPGLPPRNPADRSSTERAEHVVAPQPLGRSSVDRSGGAAARWFVPSGFTSATATRPCAGGRISLPPAGGSAARRHHTGSGLARAGPAIRKCFRRHTEERRLSDAVSCRPRVLSRSSGSPSGTWAGPRRCAPTRLDRRPSFGGA